MNVEVEEQIRKNVSWHQLPPHIKQLLCHSKEYGKMVVSFSIKNQLRYRGNLVRQILRDEKRYYERVVAYSRERLMLFPYHLADVIVKGLRITPFGYYVSVVERLLQAERSYDTLPNFTAADCLRLLGIGRNEYIEIMNHSRSSRGRLFGKRNVMGLLPRVPCTIKIEPWWRVEVGMVLEDDIKMVDAEELAVIDVLIDYGSHAAGELNYHVVCSLYKKGLIYLDVPITAADKVQVPPLQGFVMNRVLGDYFETLLYKIFVSIDEHMTIGDLAGVLQVETESVKHAVSLYCRLGFARKLESESQRAKLKRHASWNCVSAFSNRYSKVVPSSCIVNGDAELLSELGAVRNETSESFASSTGNTVSKSGTRVAFLFDSTLTAFLMMGNLSPGLKKHAVTMFEVGKLCDESLDSFLMELDQVSLSDADGEGEARRFFNHAVILRSTVLSLKRLHGAAGLDLIRLESLHALDEATCNRLLQKKYKLLVSMAPLSREVRPVFSFSPPHLGPAAPEVNSLWFRLFLYHVTGYGPPSLLLRKGTVLSRLPRMLIGFSRLLVTSWFHEPAILPVANVSHVNAALRYSPVLIQAYGVHQSGRTRIETFPFRPDTSTTTVTPEAGKGEWQKHPAIEKMASVIDTNSNCGYVTFVNIGVPDFGCTNLHCSLCVKLGNSTHRKTDSTVDNEGRTAIKSLNVESDDSLQSPVESHFAAATPPGSKKASSCSSPANGFVNHDSTELFTQELDRLEENDLQAEKVNSFHVETATTCTTFVDSNYLQSPVEETINMFSRDVATQSLDIEYVDAGGDDGRKSPQGGGVEEWTLLDCHFGIPLFDVDANTKVCAAVLGGIADPISLDRLSESSRKLSRLLLEFISECQFYPGANMGIIERGGSIPLPKYNLVFDGGHVSRWSEK